MKMNDLIFISRSMLPSEAVIRRETAGLLRLNAELERKGLALTAEEARDVAMTRHKSLCDNSRVELGLGAAEKLILKFSGSCYAKRESWSELLNLVLEIFYFVKTETRDGVSDAFLIDFMFDSFEENGGSPELLAERCEELISKYNRDEDLTTESEDESYDD